MAGAGYKLFNTGDVLTAAQVNTYLMEQSVMVFANAAARTTALSGVLAEGMLSYLKDTDAVEVYNGSAWVASDDPNAIQNSIVDAKGDLISASAADTPARLAVGNNGETLVADSSASTGLTWQGNFAAGKNKILNSAFNWWQRGTNFTSPASGSYTADRWRQDFAGTPTTWSASQQTFTPGTAPVAGYESAYFYRSTLTTMGTLSVYDISQFIEDVRTFAGQTVTISFWAKADSARTLQVYTGQNFGSGGSSTVFTTVQNASVTTSWQRFAFNFAIGSVSGKTIGTSSYLQIAFRQAVASGSVLDLWGVQVEAGSVATAFQTATGSFGGELALCQRYYYRSNGTNAYSGISLAMGLGTTSAGTPLNLPVPMRTTPTSVEFSNLGVFQGGGVVAAVTAAAIDANSGNYTPFNTWSVASGLTSGTMYRILHNNSTTGFYALSAEL